MAGYARTRFLPTVRDRGGRLLGENASGAEESDNLRRARAYAIRCRKSFFEQAVLVRDRAQLQKRSQRRLSVSSLVRESAYDDSELDSLEVDLIEEYHRLTTAYDDILGHMDTMYLDGDRVCQYGLPWETRRQWDNWIAPRDELQDIFGQGSLINRVSNQYKVYQREVSWQHRAWAVMDDPSYSTLAYAVQVL